MGAAIVIVPGTVQRLTMSDEEYFGNGLPGYISNSRMGLINPEQGGSAKKYFYGFEDESKYSAALELGSAVHALILEEDKYTLAKVDKPTGMVGPIFDTVYKLVAREETPMEFEEALSVAVQVHNYYGGKVEGKRRETLIASGKPYLEFLVKYKVPGTICLTPELKQKLLGCVDAFKANDTAMALLTPKSDEIFPVLSFNEDVIICEADYTEWEDAVGEYDLPKEKTTRVKLKAKIDNWTIDEENKVVTLNDLKTTGKSVQDFPGRQGYEFTVINGEVQRCPVFEQGSFQTYHYYRQMHMYGEMLWAYVQEAYGVDRTWTLKVNMLVVETNKPHNCQVFGVSQTWLDYGKNEYVDLMRRIVWHTENGFDKLIEFDRGLVYTI